MVDSGLYQCQRLQYNSTPILPIPDQTDKLTIYLYRLGHQFVPETDIY